MNDNEYLARIICEQLGKSLPVVLISILNLQGSTPRHYGTKMAVGVDGKSFGTIGGSLLEATAIAESKKALQQGHSRLVNFALTGNSIHSKDMICGGKAKLLLDFVPATRENLEFSKSWYDSISAGKNFFFVTRFAERGEDVSITGHCLVFADGKVLGNCSLTVPDMEKVKAELHNISSTTILSFTDGQVVIEPIRRLKTLYIFGAGHVALPTAHIAALVGFRVVVVDDRSEFANAERFPDANNIYLIQDYRQALSRLDIDKDSFIVIVTRGHQYDREVLEKALKTGAGYIGMISSRKKRETIYAALIADGITREELERVHSPIGITIGAETPEEIAVSIVAELISEREKQP